MNSTPHIDRLPLVTILVVCLLSFGGVVAVRGIGGFENLELAVYDWFMRANLSAKKADPRIVIVEITEADIQELGRWPLTDEVAARLLERLLAGRPRVVGFDIFRDIRVPPGTTRLNRLLRKHRQIIGVMKFGDGGVAPPPVLVGTDQVGFNDVVVDPGGIVRRGLLYLDDGKKVAAAISLQLAQRYLATKGIFPRPDAKNPNCLRLGATTFCPFEADDGGYVKADARGYQYLLDFGGSRGPFSSCTLKELLSGNLDPEKFKDKIVLVGVTAPSVKDLFYTPYSRGIVGGGRQSVSGVVMHARMVSQLLRLGFGESRPIRTLNNLQELGWMLFWSLVGGVIGFRLRSPGFFSIYAAGGCLLLGLVAYVAFDAGWWIPVVPPVAGFLVSAAMVTAYMSNQEKQSRAVLMHLFSRHVSPEVAASIWRQRDQFLTGDGRPRSRKMTVTVLFSDLKGFTSISEKLSPQALIDWLNSYMEAMADLVMQYGGVVDDYAGDGIKANFGVPLPRDRAEEIGDDARRAVACALAMGKKMEELNRRWRETGLPTGRGRVGICTGPVVAGAVGSPKRLKYTTVGDTVNSAARLESYRRDDLDENSCWRILIGDSTRKYLDEGYRLRFVGKVRVKGKQQAIAIYQVLGRGSDESDDRL
ncbi:MAG: adenylate/guanylate cyclase domain-containing protein [Deltaproteobacteria bacterium]|nr:adenylate/guanylate cyclase domain-containing protein [Deltaproteobacteria bacterium]